jgi:hypothetical protein
MLNKHENPSETSKSKRQKQKTKRMYDEHIEHGCTKTQFCFFSCFDGVVLFVFLAASMV